ncbi:MAG: isochorismatase family protein [Planctomycetes bacterium]|nr:isochorismatase family protein [Planctomycetota bacterium]
MLRPDLSSVLLVSTLALGAICVAAIGDPRVASARELSAQEPTAPATWAPGGKRQRWTSENCVVALIDHQTGLMNLVDNVRTTDFKSIVVGLAKTAKLHGLPVVITTSAENGPNGPYLPEVTALLPDAPIVSRPGQIDAFDNAEFAEAIRKTGRKKIVMAGITTDVCVAFAALSALDAGYEVYVVTDASGSMSPEVQNAALMRMADAGAIIGTWFALSCELLSDWRRPTGPGSAQLFIEHMPAYAEVFHSHRAAAGATPAKR